MKPAICTACGARLSDDAAIWCPQCFRRVVPVEGVATLIAELKHMEDDTQQMSRRWPRESGGMRLMNTRWHAGVTTMGPRGKIAFTLAVLALWALGIAMLAGSLLGRIGMVLYIAATAPGLWILLSATWRRVQALVHGGPARLCRVCGFGMDADAGYCPRCMVQVQVA